MHTPVLLNEAIAALQVQPGRWYLDGTFGRGGHTGAILKAGAKVIAFDVDLEAIEYGQQSFATELNNKTLILLNQNFAQLAAAITKLQAEHQLDQLQGALFDFGTSSDQLTSPTRGFSFDSQAPLDMRMDPKLGVTATDLLRFMSEKELTQALSELGGEREARSVARSLKRFISSQQPGESLIASEVAEVISRAKREPRGRIHAATKSFQALRMLVNTELEVIATALPAVKTLLSPGSRIVTIAFHEGEDRIIKQLFTAWESQAQGHKVNKEVITAGLEEETQNPRARSAKLRIFEV